MAQSDTADRLDSLVGGIVAFKLDECGARSVQEWIDHSLAENAGVSSETYILALHQSGEIYDYSSYSLALLDYLNDNPSANASTKQKYALSLLAANCRSDYIDQTVSDTIGQLGVMSWVFGLHLLSNGCVSEEYTAEDAVGALLSLRLEDGGWAVYGEVSDVDVTAMALQALAPYSENEDVSPAIREALELLSLRQLDSGAFSSYGAENAESTAQVIVALSALGIDCREDQRFVKNGLSPLDGLLSFRMENGSFCHAPDGQYSHMATSQAFCALIALQRLDGGMGSLYILDAQPDNTVELPAQTAEPTEETGGNGKLWAAIIILALAAGACVLLYLRGKRNIRSYAVVAVVAVLALLLAFSLDIQRPEDYYGTAVSKGNTIGTVTLTIRCDTVKDSGAEHIPADGIILDSTQYAIAEGDTAYDILIQAAREHSIHVDAKGAPGMRYITAIGYIYEFDHGELSGWAYRINGQQPSVGCEEYTLSDGDSIEWLYTCQIGSDLD